MTGQGDTGKGMGIAGRIAARFQTAQITQIGRAHV